MHLPSGQDMETVRTSLANLRATCRDIEQKKRSTDTKIAIQTLQQLQQEASVAVQRIGHAKEYSVGIRLLQHEHQRLTEKVDALVADLAAFHNYQGPRKVRMTTKEKSEFIKQNGLDAFEKLPY